MRVGGMNGGQMSPQNKPMPQIMGTFHKGGEVPADGAYKMQKGEKVLTKEQADHLKHSFGLASATLAHDKGPEPEHKASKKKLKGIHVKKSHNKGYIMHHTHHAPHDSSMHDEDHVAASKEEMLKHMADHEPEAPPEEAGESAGTQSQEAMLGFK
jgi:hypothetical protein